jgi:hypothetical protein
VFRAALEVLTAVVMKSTVYGVVTKYSSDTAQCLSETSSCLNYMVLQLRRHAVNCVSSLKDQWQL